MKQNIFIAALLAGMLALAGCGGGGAACDPESHQYECLSKAEFEELKAERAAMADAEKAIKAFVDAVDALDEDADSYAADLTAADGLKEAAETAIGKAPESEQTGLSAMLADAEEELELRQDNDRLAGEVNTEKERADELQDDLQTEQDKVSDLEDKVDMLEDANEQEANKEKEDSFLALFSALDKDDLADFDPTETAAQAMGQDDYEKSSVSMQGAKFSELTTSTEGTGVTIAANVITLADGANKNYIVFPGVSDGQLKNHEHNKVGEAAFEIAGSYRGVNGKYKCSGGSCSTSANDAGLIFVGTWTFTPTNKDDRITNQDVVTYGWWTNTPSDGNLMAGLFETHSAGATLAAARYELAGSATYKGDALGQYAMNADNFGAFTAVATLTATFGSTVADSLEGTIEDFKDADGAGLTGWMVKLHKTDFDSDLATLDAVAPDTNNRQARWHIGDVKGSKGEWEAGLYGGSVNSYPDYVNGTFRAENGLTGRMIGAFGGALQGN